MAKKNPHNQAFLKKVEEMLVKEKEKLEKELNKFADKNIHVKDGADYDAKFPEYGDESDENAREIAQYTVNKPLEVALEKDLRDVNNALKRIKDGTYGICKYCDEPISEKRILARPTSSACVSCKKTLKDEV